MFKMGLNESKVCGHMGLNAFVSRGTLQASGGFGFSNRSLPTGGFAKGIPSNTATPFNSLPITMPLVVEALMSAAWIMVLKQFHNANTSDNNFIMVFL
jgi:hypothetical protein